MSEGWRFFIDYQPWNDLRRLFIVHRSQGKNARVRPLTLEVVDPGLLVDAPTLDGTWESNFGVEGFMQAALDAAWEMGLRPTGFADHTNELKAVRYHLEDMRALAKVSPRDKTSP